MLTALPLAGCVHAPPVRTPVAQLPQAYEVQGQARGDVASLDRWWSLYGDAQLASLVEHALDNGFTVREAFARFDEAQATRRGALTRYGHQGNLQADAQVQRTKTLDADIPALEGIPLTELFAPATTRTASATLPLSWELDLFGRRRAARDVADASLASARFTYEGAKAKLAADVARALFEARGLAAQLDDARAAAAIQRRLNAVVAGRVQRGLDAGSQVDQLEGRLAQAAAQVTDLEGALKASRRALLVLIGAGTAPLDTLPVSLTLPEAPQIPAQLPGQVLVRRPDVREARAQLDAAVGNVRLAELAFYPTITLQAALAFASQTGGFATTTVSGSGGGSLTAPIFERARLHSELDVASARAEQAVLAYERTVQTAYSEADQALVRLHADQQRVATLQAGLMRSQRAYDASARQLKLGLIGLQEVLEAERTLRNARTALTAAKVDALSRSVQAFQALGGGWAVSQNNSDRKD